MSPAVNYALAAEGEACLAAAAMERSISHIFIDMDAINLVSAL
jgi:hypothetical protein